MKIKIGKPNDLAGVISLHKENLQPSPEGYVSFPLTNNILLEGIRHQTLIVAEDKGKVIGYLLALPPEELKSFNFWKPFFQEVKNLGLDHEPFCVMVQDCLDCAYRGRGVLQEMFYHLQKKLKRLGYSTALSEILVDNPRSISAHFKIGLTKVSETTDKKWIIVRWKI